MSNQMGARMGSDEVDGHRVGPALDGVRIVDLSTTLPGAVASHLLAELGADVVRVVHRGSGELPMVPGSHTWRRSTRTLADVDVDDARCAELIGRADVLIVDRGPLGVDPLPVDTALLERSFPRLIVAAVCPYPAGHVDDGRWGSELLVTARLGALDEQQGVRPGPVFIRYQFASWGAAYLLASGILVRLLERNRTGSAAFIQTSLLQGALAPAALYWHRAENPPPWMVAHTLPKEDNPSDLSIFRCSDGRYVQLLGGFTKSESVRVQLERLGRTDLFGSRVVPSNRNEWAPVFASRSSDEWLSELWREDIACMPVLAPGEVLATEQARANSYAVDVDDPDLGATVEVGHPIAIDPPAQVSGRFGQPVDIADLEREWSDRVATAPSAAPRSNGGALSGLRVLDFGAYVAGPLAAQCFADHGADVIKIEPMNGEKGRSINQFTGCQRGKRSLAIDLRNPGARDVTRRLVESADVVTHNMRNAAAVKLGIDDDTIRSINPRVVIATSTGYGEHGPWAGLPAFDPTALALSGIERMLVGPEGQPWFLRNSSMDTQTGLVLFLAALVGLWQRERTGSGTKVGTSLLAVASMASAEAPLVNGQPRPIEHVDPLQLGTSWHTRLYRCLDGWVAVDAPRPTQQKALLAALSCQAPDELSRVVEQRATADVLRALTDAGVPSELVAENNRDAFFDREITTGSRLVERSVSTPYGWFENPGGYWSGPSGAIRFAAGIPDVGEHNRDVLAELGFSDDDIARLVACAVIGERS
jgi:crotonobetainyl-CoA:carnitine CoA-transferase CaiB-like acyl-CoA transferase